MNYAELKQKYYDESQGKIIATGADLWGADLREADLRDAKLMGADLQGAYIEKSLVLHHYCYQIIAINNHFQIGCISKDYDYFSNLTIDDADRIDGDKAVEFLQNELPEILEIYKKIWNIGE